jgi:hypothetical protein
MRVLALRTQVAADDVVIDHLENTRLPRMYWIDYAYVQRMRRSELAWTEELVADLESGRLPWPADEEAKPELSIVDKGEDGSGKAS